MNENNKHALTEVWEKNSDVFPSKTADLSPPIIENLFGDFFSLGDYYYYVLDVANGTISHHHPNILKMHGLSEYPALLSDIIHLIHPDDLAFVLAAEEMCYNKIREIGTEHLLQLKTSYCFRMKTGRKNYELIHHQAIHTATSDEGKVLQAVNIHTNIHHLTNKNAYCPLVSGIGSRNDFFQMQYSTKSNSEFRKITLTQREMEILALIAKGMSAFTMAQHLNISEHTVRTHRKHLLAKANCKNSSELIRKAYEDGFI